jgi:hypothetical protein
MTLTESGRPVRRDPAGARVSSVRTDSNLLLLFLAAISVIASCSSDRRVTHSIRESTTRSSSAQSPRMTGAPPQDTRTQLVQRLARELGDEALAATVVGGLDAVVVRRLEQLAEGDIAGSPDLSYTPTTVAPGEVDSLWVFSFGFRIDPASGLPPMQVGGTPPPIGAVLPGPANEALAHLAAEFVARHPVPVIAQWEVARALNELGVRNVISIENDTARDGSAVYLSTAGVVQKGLRLAAEKGIPVGHAGVLCQADHAVRCLMTAHAEGITADVPGGVALFTAYDTESGQQWTRSRDAYIPVDLWGRTFFAH